MRYLNMSNKELANLPDDDEAMRQLGRNLHVYDFNDLGDPVGEGQLRESYDEGYQDAQYYHEESDNKELEAFRDEVSKKVKELEALLK